MDWETHYLECEITRADGTAETFWVSASPDDPNVFNLKRPISLGPEDELSIQVVLCT